MTRVTFLALLFTVGVGSAFSQAKKDSVRAQFVQSYPKYFFVWPVLKHRSLSFELSDVNDDTRKVMFKPNNTSSLGVGFYVFDVGFELAFAVPLDEKSAAIYGETKARDWQLNLLGKSWGMDVYFQKYSGFYKDDTQVDIPKEDPYPQRPDIDTRNFGISGLYAFNYRKFSFRAPYNYIERQLISRGSFILAATLNSFQVTADSVILTQQALEGFGIEASFKELKNTTLGIAPGYSYTAVVKRFFMNGTVTLGPAHQWVYYKKEDGTEKYDISFNTNYSIRFAAGYNGSRVFGGVGFILQSRVVQFESVRFENSSSTVRVMIGYRFKKRGILEKSAMDIFSFLKS